MATPTVAAQPALVRPQPAVTRLVALVIVAGETVRLRGLDPDIRAQVAGEAAAARQQVNAIAYLASSGPTVPFTAQSHFLNCGPRGDCTTMTDAVLLTDPQVRATWPEQAPLRRSSPSAVRSWLAGAWLTHNVLRSRHDSPGRQWRSPRYGH